MLAAIITLSLLSLLVATEADPSSPAPDAAGTEPLRPPGKTQGDDAPGENRRGRLAA